MWIANLDNGQNVMETPPVPGEASAWQKLLNRCRSGEVKITGLQLFIGNVAISALPKKQCDGYFQAHEMRRTMLRGAGDELPDQDWQGVGAVIGEQVFITWIWLNPPSNEIHIRSDVWDLSSCRIHTTLA